MTATNHALNDADGGCKLITHLPFRAGDAETSPTYDQITGSLRGTSTISQAYG